MSANTANLLCGCREAHEGVSGQAPSAGFTDPQSYRTQPRGQRPPASDGPHAQSRLRIVRNAREQLTQLDGSREFATLLIGGADHRSLRFGDDEHRQSMGYVDRRVQVFRRV